MRVIKTTIKYLLILSMIMSPSFVMGEMRSDSYVIHENVNHAFDGPVISAVSHIVSGVEVTVSFNTNVIADAFVIYDTESAFVDSVEQGTSVKNETNHTVVLKGLSPNALYYYRVRSQSVNGGVTTDLTARSFTTGTDPNIVIPEEPQSGGGILIIDKTDKVAPVISNVQIQTIDDNSVSLSWDTNEESTSFGEYGESQLYGNIDGNWDKVMKHSVKLTNLIPSSVYNIRAISSDGWGNIGYGENILFNTIAGEVDENTILPEISTTTEAEKQEEIDQSILAEAAERMMDFVKRLFPQAVLNDATSVGQIKTIEELSRFIPAPILSGEPRLEISYDHVIINWITDIKTTSQVGVSSDEEYKNRRGELYTQIVGDAQILNTEHSVQVYGLKPDTLYHYQLRSKSSFGPLATSRDFSFRTTSEGIKITSFLTQIKDAQTAVVKWITNKEANSAIQFAPYRNNLIALDESKTIRNNEFGLIHEIEIADFQAGVYYDVEIISVDKKGDVVREKIDRFSTQEKDMPPVISHIKTDSTVFVDKNNKTQTVISWLTDEPTSGQIFFQEGVYGTGTNLSESTDVNTNFIKEHVFVITKFKPGVVYSFQVKAIDSTGNEVMSKIHTFMTAKKKESIIQVIIKILEDTFGWAKKLM